MDPLLVDFSNDLPMEISHEARESKFDTISTVFSLN